MSEANILKIICGNGGAIDYERLLELASGFPDINCFEFDSLIENKQLFSLTENSGVKQVLAKTNVRLCKVRDCTGCKNLHLCKFYLHGECKGRRCGYGHNLNSDHNAKVLSEHQLQRLSRAEIRQLLLHNDSPHSLLPPLCMSYNHGEGDYGRCDDKDNCTRLHICEGYIQGTCDSGNCGRSHDFFEPHPMRTLRGRGVPSGMVGSMLSVYRNILVLRGTLKSNAGAKNRSGRTEIKEICLSFVKADCKQRNRCWRVHSKMPYQWQFKAGETWTDFPISEDIERDFCNPSCASFIDLSVKCDPVCFDTMTCGPQEVRRLSTAPSVLMPDFILTTEWLWYWEDEYGKWVPYSSTKEMHRMSSVSSSDLEKRYQDDNNAVVLFTAGNKHYELSFKDMEQKNVYYGTPRQVRRRPEFISSVGVQTARTSKRRGPVSSQHGRGVPGYWDKSAVPETGYKRVTLLSTDRDYLKVQELFCKTLSGFDIISIERIQNKELWEDFQTKRERMTKANKDKKYAAGERLLFHGTDSKFIDAICYQNFDWRKSGANGTVYGEGCYFARDARYSNSYTSDHSVRSMFVCRVLAGSYTRGQSQYRLPPSIDGGLLLYDSCVNDVRDPSIFVVFDKQQVYPEFLITYTEHVYITNLTDSSPDYASSAVSGLLSPVKTTATSTQSNSLHSSTTLTGITSALKTVTVSTLTSSSFVSPPSVVSSPSLSSAKPSTGSPQSSVINPILIPPSFVSPPSVVSSPSLSSAKPSTASPQSSVMNPILYPPSSSLKPAQVLPATRTSAGSATLPAPVPASTSSMLPNSHPLQAVQMRKSDVSSDDCDFEFVDSFYSPSSKSTSTALSNPGRSSSSALNQQWVPKPVPSRRLYSSSDASLVSTTMRSATPKSTSTRRVSPPRQSTTTSSYTESVVTLPTSPRSQDLYNVPTATRRQNHGAKKKEECILL